MRWSICAIWSAPDKDSGPALRFKHRAIVSDLSAERKLSAKLGAQVFQPERCTLKLLAIDDTPQNLELITAAIAQNGLEILTAADAESGLELFLQARPQVVLLDLVMPQISGMELLERMMAADPGVDVILMTAHCSTDSAVEAIQKGACDYLTKPLDIAKLRNRVSTLLADAEKRQRAIHLDNALLDTHQFEGIIGRSPVMLDVFGMIQRIAPHFQNALITGASGTGKERAAQALHNLSPVSRKTFAVCNCSSLAETLYESELFGYVRGAFTGALQDKVGLFEYANGGTVFLDEIGDMPLAGQAKLLRVLQNREIQRVGSPAVRHVDVRVIAATNQDLRAMVRQKKFREDLFYRLSTVEIRMPLLSERKEDLPLLERYFLGKSNTQLNKQIRALTPRARLRLSRHSWPGNVRELENVIANACMMTEGELIDVGDLPAYLREGSIPGDASAEVWPTMEEVQRRHLVETLTHVGGNKLRAAEVLEIGRSTIYKILNQLDTQDSSATEIENTR
jgi:DNA-binding NtrC family response regulator